MKIPRCPPGLDAAGRRFYRQVMAEYELDSAHDRQRLFQACRSLDSISEAEKILEVEGAFIFDRFKQRKEHPAAKTVRENRIIFTRILRELCLDVTTPDSRPPRSY